MIGTEELILRLLLGTMMGGLIGYERQTHGRPAGFRTHMLVCTASVLLMLVSEYNYHLTEGGAPFMRVDPGRIAAGAITGIGFLGAGVIVKTGATISGLTTAACIWMVSAIGLSVGTGMYVPAFAGFVLTIFALLVMRAFEKKMPGTLYRTLVIAAAGGLDEDEVDLLLQKHGASLQGVDYEKDVASGLMTYRMTIACEKDWAPRKVLDGLSALGAVSRVSITSQ